MIAAVRSMRWTILASLALGALMATLTPAAWLDSLFPVVTMRAEIVTKHPAEIVMRLIGTKHRDCRYEGINAFARMGDLLRDLHMDRIDKPADGQTKPKGRFDFGTWRVWPTANTKLVEVYVQYDCGGRSVFVRAAEVAL